MSPRTNGETMYTVYDGRIIYKSGDEAVPLAIAVTEADAAAIVTALAVVAGEAPGQ